MKVELGLQVHEMRRESGVEGECRGRVPDSYQFLMLLSEAGGQSVHVRVLQGLPAQLVGLHVDHPTPDGTDNWVWCLPAHR